ncbi:hypothetical protein GCM10012275_28440 [Longimycelium tulufanense]|uniref:Uncharacterized protein n=1 Tax=Longimycelium tulufanense TaxID=907463 RepID=A0A8J3CG46_9PSEU|nr:hypothetical protein GCM10012275_28440 [Longimycelium tulufanense]
MSLADRLREPTKRPRSQCTFGLLLGRLEGADRKALDTALADERYTSRNIAEALQAEGYDMRAATVRRHRRGECSCEHQNKEHYQSRMKASPSHG